MPYFVYKIFPGKKLEFVEQHFKYRDAKTFVKAARPDISVADNYQLRIMFANSQAEAEKLLTTKREAQPLREDDL